MLLQQHGRKQDNLPVAALESRDQETQTQQGKCEAYVLGCFLKSILTLLHKHAYTHTNTNTNTQSQTQKGCKHLITTSL